MAWSDREGRTCLLIQGWTATELRELADLTAAERSSRLAVLPTELVEASTDLGALQPVAGRFELEDDAICFIPRFPFVDGTSYSLLVESTLGKTARRPLSPTLPGEGGRGMLSHFEAFTIQRPARNTTPATRVVAIYPSADELPVNQLKLYVHFSRPMSEGWALRAVHVRRADTGEPLEGVFLSMEPELWDPQRQRLTLLLDPGRIKRGLVPNQEVGYPLIEGVPVVVSVDSAFRDANGRPLRTEARARYNIGPPVRARVDPRNWRYDSPAAGSMTGLSVTFDRPLDHALLEHCLRVIDAAGASVPGEATIGPAEWCWWFEPRQPWKEGRHQLVVAPLLEDLAGNSLIRVFDRDLTRAEDAPAEAAPVVIEFSCA